MGEKCPMENRVGKEKRKAIHERKKFPNEKKNGSAGICLEWPEAVLIFKSVVLGCFCILFFPLEMAWIGKLKK